VVTPAGCGRRRPAAALLRRPGGGPICTLWCHDHRCVIGCACCHNLEHEDMGMMGVFTVSR